MKSTQAELRVASAEAERAYREACADGDEQAIAETGLEYVHACYVVHDSGTELLAPFTRVVRIMDAAPPWWSQEHTSAVLWAYKWVVRAVLSDPDVSLDGVEKLLAGMERRYKEHGRSLRPVVKMKMILARESRGLEPAADLFEQWRSMDRTELCDCEECEPTLLVRWYFDTDRLDEAVSLALEVMNRHGESQCMDQPQDFYAEALEPLLVAGRDAEASWVQRMGHRLDRRQPSRTNFLAHGQVLARSGNTADALVLLRLAAGEPSLSPRGEASDLAVAANILRCQDAEVPAEEFWPGIVGQPHDVSDQLMDRALSIATRFDERNGSSAASDRIKEIVARGELPKLSFSSVAAPPVSFDFESLSVAGADPSAVDASAVDATVVDTKGPGASGGDESDSLSDDSMVSSLRSSGVPRQLHVDLAFAGRGYEVVDADSAWSDLRQSIFENGSCLRTNTIVEAWTEFSETEAGKEQVCTESGALLDCLAFFPGPEDTPGPSTDLLDRAEATAGELGLAAVSRFVELMQLCAVDQPTEAQQQCVYELTSDVDLAGCEELASIGLGFAYRRSQSWGRSELGADLALAFEEALSRSATGLVAYLQVQLELRLQDADAIFDQFVAAVENTGHRAERLFKFCTMVALGHWTRNEYGRMQPWVARSTQYLSSISVPGMLLPAMELQFRLYDASESRQDGAADFLINACRHLAVISPEALRFAVTGVAMCLRNSGFYLDLVELGEAALAVPGDGSEDHQEQLTMLRGEVGLACAELGEMSTAVGYAKLACEAGIEHPQVWSLYALQFWRTDDSVGLVRVLSRCAELFWDHAAYIPALDHTTDLAVAIVKADGVVRAETVTDDWEARVEALPADLEAQVVSLAESRIAMMRCAAYLAAEDFDEALRCAELYSVKASACGHPDELVAAHLFEAEALWGLDQRAVAEEKLQVLFDKFPEGPRTEYFDRAVSMLMHILSSTGRVGEAEEFGERFRT